MKNFFLLSLLLICFVKAHSQSADTIEIRKSFGTKYMQKGKVLKPRQLVEIMKTNSEALAEMRKAKSNFDAGSVIGAVGGFMVGWELGTSLGGRDADWGVAGAGAGLIVVSLLFNGSYNSHAKAAIHLYNSDLKKSATSKLDLNIRPYGAGVSVQLRF